ncbi:MAG TPA: Dna2/Cas4 domain-containing protein [Candidatus Parcubacteria bacterium]|nr:Dna2/Cas4 domain-containing protein [Candidatus Parcubacteria bacterium]
MLKEFIDKFYLDKERDKKERIRKKRTQFYISEAGKCPRSIFFRFKQAPAKEIEAERLRLFEYGNYIHQLVLRPLFSLGLVRSTEIDIPPQELVVGRADAIISVKGEPYVLDIKSITGRIDLRKMKEPKIESYYQVQLYLHYFGIKKGILLYLNKDTNELKEFVFDYDKKVVEKILADFEDLRQKIEKDIVPPRLEDYPANWQCRYCEFYEVCKLGERGEMKWPDLKSRIIHLEEEENKEIRKGVKES